MGFINTALDGLKTVVTALGGGVGVWGVINLLENPDAIQLSSASAFFRSEIIKDRSFNNVPSKFGVRENRNPCKFLTYRDSFVGVPGRTRTLNTIFPEISERFKLLIINMLCRYWSCRHIS